MCAIFVNRTVFLRFIMNEYLNINLYYCKQVNIILTGLAKPPFKKLQRVKSRQSVISGQPKYINKGGFINQSNSTEHGNLSQENVGAVKIIFLWMFKLCLHGGIRPSLTKYHI